VAVLSQESERKCATGIEMASSFEFSIGFLKCFVVYFLFVMGFDLVGSFKLKYNSTNKRETTYNFEVNSWYSYCYTVLLMEWYKLDYQVYCIVEDGMYSNCYPL
jgi:hypothetical protein